MFYFTWITEEEVFDSSLHQRHDESLYGLTLHHKEGQPALLTIVVSAWKKPPKDKIWCLLSYQSTSSGSLRCLFRGQWTQTCEIYQERYNQLSFKGQKESFEAQWEALAPSLKEKPFYHELLDKGSYEDVLAGRPMALYWDRLTGDLSLSHAIKGRFQRDLTPSYQQETLSYALTLPPQEIKVTLSAQWLQTLTGYYDIMPTLAKAFPGQHINSYTGKALSNSWPKTGSSVGRSGYYILHSSIKEKVSVPFKKPLVPYNHLVPLKDKETRSLAVKRSWFDAELVIGYYYRQKRKENLSFTLRSSLPKEYTALSASLSLSLGLQKIVDHEDLPHLTPFTLYKKDQKVQHRGRVYQAKVNHGTGLLFDERFWQVLEKESFQLFPTVANSFFLTPRGYEVFYHGLERAKTALTWHSRCFEVRVKGSLEAWADLTLDHSVFLEDDRLGKVEGKITEYKISLSSRSTVPEVSITFKGRVGQALEEPKPFSSSSYAEGYVSETYVTAPKSYECRESIWYKRYDDQRPDDPLEFLIRSQLADIMESVAIENLPQHQEQYLLSLDPEKITHEKLKNKETKILLHFHRIHTVDCLTHNLQVDIATPWFDPS